MKYTLPEKSLQPLPKDPRDFPLGAVFPQINLHEVPAEDFVVATPLLIKDQGETDFCSAYALTSVSEDQEGEELLPEYQFYRTKQIAGNPDEWGANLRDACKSATKYGSLPLNGFLICKGLTRSKLLIPEQWPAHADDVAIVHKKETYFEVEGRYDTFDNIRTALWQHHADKCSVLTGCLWRTEWLDASDGIIGENYGDNGFGHAFKIFGQKTIKGKMYLMAQLSQGDAVGDGGIFYLSREIVNKEIGDFGIYMFKDISKEDAQYYLENKITEKSNFFDWLKTLFNNLFGKKKYI